MLKTVESPLLEALLLHFRSVRSRRIIPAVGIWGAAGLGKTYLVQQLVRQVGCRVVVVLASASPRTLATLLPVGADEAAWVARTLERLEQGETLGPQMIADALAERLAAMAPVLLCAEDLHDASPDQVQMWTRLAVIAGRTKGVGVLISSRSPLPESLESYPLLALSAEEVRDLLQEQAGGALPAAALQWIQARASGNPLFSLEYFRFLARRGNLWNGGQMWNWRAPEGEPMPDTVEALLARSLVARNPQTQEALLAAAMLPVGPLDLSTWAVLAGLTRPALTKVRRELAERGVLLLGQQTGDTFAHPLYREVALREASAELKRAVAQRAVQFFRDTPRLAGAYVLDAKLSPEQASLIFRAAAGAAQQVGAQQEEARWWQGEFEVSGQAKAGLKAAELYLDTEPARAEELARAAGEAADAAAEDRLESVLLRAHALAEQSRADVAENLLLALPQPERERIQVRWLRHLLRVRASRQQFPEVVKLWDTHPELHAQPDHTTVIQVGNALMRVGRLEEAESLYLAQLEAAKHAVSPPEINPKINQAELYQALAGIAYFQDNHPAAFARLNAGLELLDSATEQAEPKLLRIREMCLTNRAFINLVEGKLQAALLDYQGLYAIHEKLGDGQLLAKRQGYIGTTLLELGRYAEAEQMLLAANELLERQGEVVTLAGVVKPGLRTLYQETPQVHGSERALQYAYAGLRLNRQLGIKESIGNSLISTAECEALVGQPEHARELLTDLVVQNHPGKNYVLGLLAAREGRLTEARELIEPVIRHVREQEYHLHANSMVLELAKLTGDIPALQALQVQFEQSGYVHGQNKVRRALHELSLTHPDAPVVAAADDDPVRMDVLGSLRVQHGGQTHQIKGQQRRQMLALLLEARLAGRDGLSHLELAEPLYPGLNEAEALTRLHQLVYHLRRSLGAGLIHTTPNGYALGECHSDVEAFQQSGDTALWRGPFLADLGGGADQNVQASLYSALLEAAQRSLAGNPREAARAARIVLEAEPYHKAALALTIQALRDSGNRKGALTTYREARERFAEVDEALPEEWSDFLEEQQAGA